MKRILLFLFMLLCLMVVMATGGINDNKNCGGGDQRPTLTPDPIPWPADSLNPDGQLSYDPNEIIGPTGYDSLRWISINDVLDYTIMFENDPEFATANAQRVDVRFEFDKKELMKDFILGGYGFANMSWEMEKPSNTYQNRINLVDTMSIYVDLIAGLDVTKNQAFWKFSSIDPESGFAPWQSDRGMLPVNDSTHVGEGFVRFSIKPVSTMHTGDTISIQANIVFDENDTIPTNRWKNVIDAGTPTSRVTATVDADNAHLYRLKFEAADDETGSGVKQVYLYLANQFGTYEEYAVCAPDSILLFETEPGRSYEFYTLAEDNVGNREPLKEKADVVLNNNAAPTDIALSSTKFQDDIQAAGFIAEISSVDTEEDGTFIYALAEGDGAIHNDLFQIEGTQLQAKNCFKCASDSIYKIRLSTTDKGGLTFSKAFELSMENVLLKPLPDTLTVDICEGETCLFHGVEYDQTGIYRFTRDNEFMCDSLYVLNLTVHPHKELPLVTIEGTHTLVSSAAKGNQWFKADGTPVEGAIEQKFTPEEDGIYYVVVSNGSCYSDPSQLYQVKLSDYIDLNLNIKKGWNWVSSNLSEATHQQAKQFLQPIENITERFVGQVDELINDPVSGLIGGLTTINPTESYKLKVSENANNTWSGNGCKPETTTVPLQKGWNWIGYVPVLSNSLSDALSGITPSENDIIKCMDNFATYNGGKWVGTLTELKPGEGYLYYAAQSTTFNYPIQRVSPIPSESPTYVAALYRCPWTYDTHRYPDNATLIGELYVNDAKTFDGVYTVGAFCNNECRGVGRYIDNRLFLAIHGTMTKNEKIVFKAYENATGNEYDINESIVFKGQQEGSYGVPFALHANTNATSISEMTESGFNIYPRPLHSRLFVSGDVANIKTIQILSANGVVNMTHDGYTDDGIDVSALQPGVYVVAIVQNNGNVYYEKVVKAQN